MSAPPLSLAAIRQPAFLYDADGRIAEANDLAEALAGRPLAGRTFAALVGIFDIRSQDGIPLMAADLPAARALACEEAVDVPLVVRADNGRTLHVLTTAAPIRNGGEAVGALECWQDMSVRETIRAEAETAAEEPQMQGKEPGQQGSKLARAVSDLDRQRRLLDGVLGAMPHHVSLWDRDQRLVWANERFAAALGEPRATMVGRTWPELWREAPEIAPLVEGALRAIGAGTPFTREVESSGPEGPGWRAVTFLPIFGDQVLVITEDVTERKRAEDTLQQRNEELAETEEELRHQNEKLMAIEAELRQRNDELLAAEHRIRESEERFRLALRNAPVRVAMMDRDLRYVWAFNQQTAQRDEIVGHTDADLFTPGEAAHLAALTRRVLEEDVEVREQMWLDRPGGPMYLDIYFEPVHDETGSVTGVGIAAVDLTRRRLAEEKVARLVEQHRLALNAARMGWWHYDPATRIASYDDRYREIFEVTGMSRPNDEILRRLHPDDLPGVWEQVEAAQDPVDPKPYSTEYRIVMPDGAVKWVEAHGLAIFEGTGENRRATSLVGTVADITDRKRAEGALSDSEARFRSLSETSPIAISVTTADGRTLYVNRAHEALFGYSWGDPERAQADDFYFDPGDREMMLGILREQGNVRDHEVRLRRRDGTPFWVSLSVSPIVFGGQQAILGLIIDITERKEAEEVLRETRDYLDNLINYANAPIIVWNPDLRITRFNAAFEHLSGYAADEVIGKELSVLFPVDSREESLEKIQHTITEQWQAVEIPILRPDGGVRIALWNSANIYDKEGTALLATIAQGQDITDRKEAEKTLRIYAENLQRSNEDLERYAYVSSHDLQEPLRAIISFSQLLERRYKGQLGTDADDYINFITEGGTRMQTLIQDLLAYSRVNTTKQDLRPTDMEDVMAAVERNLDVALRESGGMITFGPMPEVMADPLQLEQVVTNLVSNAITFRRPDEPLRIHVGARQMDGFWEFSVTDNGIGIEAEYFERIFVIFQRLHTKDRYPGTGIGLAIVKRIIDRHGGRVWVESTPGEGSTFCFTLPAA